jgi:VIT1/CCC1 family predicted Fe2+/Mn2+ transporter
VSDDRPEIHHTHRNVNGGWLRPAVFGAMDGLVSNGSLIAGAAGGSVARGTVALIGLAGLFAGAFSMAAGEYTSVASQAEMIEAEIATERRELARRPHAEEHELALLYQSRGLTPDLAREVARQLSANPEQVWRIHAREEHGIDPDELPNPLVAAGSSFAAFAAGALLPLLPYLVGGAHLLAIAFAVSAVALLALGATVSRFTERSPWFSGARQLAFGVAAAGVTYAIGTLVGTGVGG